jgi:glycerophosphoryl diester phosphodiesterase
VLDWARGRTIVVLDQKDVPLATRVGKITEHRAEAFAMVIVNSTGTASTRLRQDDTLLNVIWL